VFDHITIRASNRNESERFYSTVLAKIGIEQPAADEHYAEWDDFSLAAADDENPVTRHLHIGFLAPSRAHVDAFWRAGTDAGYRDDGRPGPRPQYSEDYYGAFLLDPDGNSAEAVHHRGAIHGGGGIDHLWIGVRDVAAARRFYELVGRYGGFRLVHDSPDRARFAGSPGSFSLVSGRPPTEHVHLAFPVPANGTVDEFHRAAVAAGYRDNGPPGERRLYHPGYYGAYVLDPDGNNVELVNHNRS
jgi:catechol 2,3-dioxygenase-like lactoylglutathione lyase family enzyme